jgi:hypothetical protein
MICRQCGHSSGMHDEHGCVALSCLCNRYIPTLINAILDVQPPRLPLNAKSINLPFEPGSRNSLRR